MPLSRVDRWFGPLLFLIALCWSWIVFETIPAGQDVGDIGPRAVPLLLGLLLGAFGLFLTVGALLARDQGEGGTDGTAPVTRREVWIVGSTFALLIIYAFLLDKIGFILATPIVVFAAMRVVLGLRHWIGMAAMAAGLTVGCYLVFAVLMGANLPRGAWIQLY